MNSEKITLSDAQILQQWINSQPRSEYYKHRSALRDAIGEDDKKMRSMLYGYSRIPNAAKILMNRYAMEVSGEPIFEIDNSN